jgi:hypothetical protein
VNTAACPTNLILNFHVLTYFMMSLNHEATHFTFLSIILSLSLSLVQVQLLYTAMCSETSLIYVVHSAWEKFYTHLKQKTTL